MTGWAVRVLDKQGIACGAGVLLDGRRILTCAHVVNAALGRGHGNDSFPAGRVAVEVASHGPLACRVLDDGWFPITGTDRGDIAVLESSIELPGSGAPLSFAAAPRSRVRVSGYPRNFATGVEARAELRGTVGPGGWMQLESEQPKHPIRPGFSGAGVVHDETDTVVGIVVADHEKSGTSWMIPLNKIAEILPWLSGTMAARPPAINTLPPDLADFTGRTEEIDQLLGALANGGQSLAIHAIDGMGGIGKTSLAVYLAYKLADHYPDGLLFIDLQGHTHGKQPIEPRDALASLLGMLRVTPGPELAALWRDELSRKRVLVVLDNAASSDKVADLLPGSTSRSLVLITSRRRLQGLSHTRPYSLDVLVRDEARDLFRQIVPEDRTRGQDDLLDDIIELCGRLPLAVRIVACRLRDKTAWQPADCLAELRATRHRLKVMRVENLSVRAAFELSYSRLGHSEQRLFRRIGLHPSPILDRHAAIALDGGDPDEGAEALETLIGYSLLREVRPNRYRLHDLLYEFARDVLTETEGLPARTEVSVRILDYYLHCALTGHTTLLSYRPIDDRVDHVPDVTPLLDTLPAVLAWFDVERDNLLACASIATEFRKMSYLWRIPRAMGHYLGLATALKEAGSNYALGLTWAVNNGDDRAEADMTARNADVHHAQGKHAAALGGYLGAREHYRQIGDLVSAADMLNRAGACQRMTGNLEPATTSHTAALAEFTRLGDLYGQAEAHYLLAMVARVKGDFPEAVAHHRVALVLYRSLPFPLGEARSDANIGVINNLKGNPKAALGRLARALRIYRELGDRRGVANTLNNAASALANLDRLDEALTMLNEAIRIFNEIGGVTADAQMVKGRLLRRLDRLDEAREQFHLALAHYRRAQAGFGAGEANRELSMTDRAAGRAADALPHARESLSFHRKTGSKSGEALALFESARCLADLGEYGEARRLTEEAIPLCDKYAARRTGEIRAFLDSLPG